MQYLSNYRAVFVPKNKQFFGPILKKKLLIKKKSVTNGVNLKFISVFFRDQWNWIKIKKATFFYDSTQGKYLAQSESSNSEAIMIVSW